MKKKVVFFILMTVLIVCCASCHKHTWKDATCTEPKTCTDCNETEGEPLGHDWKEATCTEPKTCSRCGATEGEALGHDVSEWSVTKEATCAEEGVESGTCSRCNQTVERAIPTVEHTEGDWEVTVKPTKESEGTRVKKCKVCGEVLKTENFKMSEKELKKQFKESCKTYSYEKLERNPDKYEGKPIKIEGYVVQVCSEAESALYYSTYRVATSGRYDNIVYVKIDNYGKDRILEDDYITVYGTYDGIYSYTTVRGDTISIPSVTAEYCD